LLEACLVLSRSQSGLDKREVVDLSSIVSGLVRTADLRGLTADARLERALTRADAQLVERLASNLLTNAIHHNLDGGRIELATSTTARRAILTVANTGPIIPAGEVARLFQPFQRFDAHPGLCADGLGLGLAIVQAIARAHDAFVTARRRPGGGLAIEISFPTLD
jgi:signal transduction histidine kinase